MAHRFFENVQETTEKTGTGVQYDLEGAVLPGLVASSQASEGDASVWAIWDNSDYELIRATWHAGPPKDYLTRTGFIFSTAGVDTPVNWPDTNAKNVACVASGADAESLFDPAAPNGWMVRTAAGVYGAWPFVAGTDVTISDVTGATSPTFDTRIPLADLLRRANAGSPTERTMSERLILGAAQTIITGYLSNKHALYKDDGLSDKILEIEDVGGLGNNFILRQMYATALEEILNTGNFDANIPYTPHSLFDSNSVTTGTASTIRTTYATIVIPAGSSDYVIACYARFNSRKNASGGASNYSWNLQYDRDSDTSWQTIDSHNFHTHDEGGGSELMSSVGTGFVNPADADTTYRFRMNHTGGSINGSTPHHLHAIAFRPSA